MQIVGTQDASAGKMCGPSAAKASPKAIAYSELNRRPIDLFGADGILDVVSVGLGPLYGPSERPSHLCHA